MLPAVLACYELWFGTRRWWQLAPFVAAAAVFVSLSLFVTPPAVGPYRFHFTLKSLARTSKYYAGRVFLIPLLGYALPIAAYFARSKRAWFGLATLTLFFLPLFFLPGRIFSAYCYLPFVGLAVAVAGLTENLKPAVLALSSAAFLAPDIYALHKQTVDTLKADHDIQIWMDTVGEHLRKSPVATGFVYDGLPAGFWPFGAQATLRYYLHRFEVPMAAAWSPEEAALRQTGTVDVLRWNAGRHVLEIR